MKIRTSTTLSGNRFSALKTITGITKADPGVVSATGHGIITGDRVFFVDLTEMTELNGAYDTATKINNDTFSIQDTSGFGAA